ncbi:MAG: phenylalanyl-tRNA synthetase beta chain [Gammaproteobacteria bacterium]|jgi:phenylalanyl-tRNA synthetase beta chain
MKLSEQWLRQWVSPSLTTEELAEQLTMAGFEVENVESCDPGFENIIVARVEEVEPHADADRLNICKVNTGAQTNTVVCGADNVAVGKCFPLALPGAILPDGRKIGESILKGVNSAGMLCSADELELSNDADKLLELDDDAVPGVNLKDHLQLNDHVFDISLTPNRGDCLSLAGIAREISVLNDLPMKVIKEEKAEISSTETRIVSLREPLACPRYAGRVVSDIDITKKAPDWILERLRRAELRSINVVVDLTNYVMLELGQPMHAFDNDKLRGEIAVRFSNEGEELTLLDGQHCKLQENTLLITDTSGPIAMAGIMGGLQTAVSADTRHLFLESAYFNPETIAGRARAYGLHTDASHRYERGVDFTLQERALERLTVLLIKYCGGKVGSMLVVAEPSYLPPRPSVELNMATLSRVLGVEIELPRVKEILQLLGLGVKDKLAGFTVSVPAFRFDITIEADLVEEIARIYGYNNMPSTAPHASLRMHDANAGSDLLELKQCLVNRGYHEIITYSFTDKEQQEKILGVSKELSLLNPISSELGVMRRSLLPGLLGALSYNHNRQQDRIRLFECGKVFIAGEQLEQKAMIGGILSGEVLLKQWDKIDSLSDIYDLKSDVEVLLQIETDVEEIEYRIFQHSALHSGQSAQIFIKNQLIGMIGALHPRLMKAFDLRLPTFVFELDLSQISLKKAIKFTKTSKFPIVKRDISILVEQQIPVFAVMNCIKKESKELLNNLELFDLYQGEGIDLEKKSLALGLTFQKSSSTLTEEEVESVMVRILNALFSEFGATLRE